MKKTYKEWIASELAKLGLTKAVYPHCGNDDPELMRENWYFTHGKHEALNYQCHNHAQCGNYFKIGPLSECACGWTRQDAELMGKEGKEWIYQDKWSWVKAPEGMTWTYLGNGIWDWREKVS